MNPKNIAWLMWTASLALTAYAWLTEENLPIGAYVIPFVFFIGVGYLLFYSKQPKDDNYH